MTMLFTYLCPPLAVLCTGNRTGAIQNLALTALFYVPGVIHARREVDRYETARHHAALLRAMGLV